MAVEIILVDDHQVVRDGIKAVLGREADFAVVGEARDGAAAVEVCRRLHPSVVLMDVNLPGMNGIDATAQIRRECPEVNVVVLSMRGDEGTVMGAIGAGASGFVLKQSSFSEVITALRAVAAGGTYWSAGVSDRLLSAVRTGSFDHFRFGTLGALSSREHQVLHMIGAGKSMKEIAASMQLEHSTIRSCRKTIMRKLDISHTAGLIKFALEFDKEGIGRHPVEAADRHRVAEPLGQPSPASWGDR